MIVKKLAHPLKEQPIDPKDKGKIDLPLIFVTIGLVIIGLIMVYDSSVIQSFKDYGDKYYYIRQQFIWAILGLIALGFFSIFNYKYFRSFTLPLLLISFLMTLAVFIPGLGVSAGGAHRWLSLGFVTLQPAEVIKMTSILFFAHIFERGVRTFPFLFVVLAVTLVLGILQRDLGSSIVFFLTSSSIFLVAGANLFYFAALTPVAFLGFIFFILNSSYRKQRVLAFLDPFSDPQGYTYHISQVLIALGSGGWFGLGLGQSRQKFEYIPEVTTDSIFAIVGEEFGFFGSTVLILLISYLIFRGFKIAQGCPDQFGKLLAFGLTAWLGIQAAINIAAMVSLVPLTGVPLPFISYGGSALMTNLVAVGILLNISRHSKIQ